MVTMNRWNYSAMLARGGDHLTAEEIEERTRLVNEGWMLLGQRHGKAGVKPENLRIRQYLDTWLKEMPLITDPAVHEAKRGYRFYCKVGHVYDADFLPFEVDALVAIPSLKALNKLIRSTFHRDCCVIDWKVEFEPF